jgi:ribosome recycling factor
MLEQKVKTADMSILEYKRRLSKAYESYDSAIRNIRKSTSEEILDDSKSAK